MAVGYRLDELTNDITRSTVAAFEPSIDYVVVKIPRWDFEKFGAVDRELGPQMKSVGEVMAIGRTFKAALQKGIRSLEIGRNGWGPLAAGAPPLSEAELTSLLQAPNRDRLFAIYSALERRWPLPRISQLTGFDLWFVDQLAQLHTFMTGLTTLDAASLRQGKRLGCSDVQLAELLDCQVGAEAPLTEAAVKQARLAAGIQPSYHQVDTCAAEFQAFTLIFTAVMTSKTRRRLRKGPRSSFWEAGPTASARALNSTIAASMPVSPCGNWVTRPS